MRIPSHSNYKNIYELRAQLLAVTAFWALLTSSWVIWKINIIYEPKAVSKYNINDKSFIYLNNIAQKSEYAYVTLLSSDDFLPGCLNLVESLSESRNDIIIMLLPAVISEKSLHLLAQTRARIIAIHPIRNPYSTKMVARRQRYNFSKLRAWQLISYSKIILIDSDMLVIDSIDDLFDKVDDFAAVRNYQSPFASLGSRDEVLFNSGLMVLRPSMDEFKRMGQKLGFLYSYNGGDQGFLNSYFKSWQELPPEYNVNKLMLKYSDDAPKSQNIKVVHFVRAKPWQDIASQWKYLPSKKLIDKPGDHAVLNQLWKSVYLKSRLSSDEDLSLIIDTPIQKSKRKCFKIYLGNSNEEVQHCVEIIENYCPEYFTDCLGSLKLVADDLTLVTQLSNDRLERLENLAAEWHGPISAVVFVPKSGIRSLIREILFKRELPFARLKLTILVSNDPSVYPINFMRNLAIENANSDMVFVTDVDFIPSPWFYADFLIKKRMKYIRKLTKLKYTFVVPAFQFARRPSCLDLSSCSFIKTDDLKILAANGEVSLFHPNGKGQLPINLKLWLLKGSELSYNVEWEEWFEPYMIFRKSALSDFNANYYDERFYNRGRNKMILPLYMQSLGFKFAVLKDYYLLHAWNESLSHKARPGMKGRHKLYSKIHEKLKNRQK